MMIPAHNYLGEKGIVSSNVTVLYHMLDTKKMPRANNSENIYSLS